MTENENTSLENWDNFLGNWLKPDVVTSTPAKVVVMKTRSDIGFEDKKQVVLTVNYNSKKFDFSLNNTNMKFLKEEAKLMPNQLINKTLILVKDKVYNPSIKKRVDSLFIDKVE